MALVGREYWLECIYLAMRNEQEHAAAFWEQWEKVPVDDRPTMSLDEVAFLGNVRPDYLMADAVIAGVVMGSRVSEMVFAAQQAKVVSRLGKSAMRIGGSHADISRRDRHAFLQHNGFIPQTRGALVTVNANAKAESKAAAAAAATANQEPSVPSFLQDLGSAQLAKERVQKSLRALPARDGDTASDSEDV